MDRSTRPDSLPDPLLAPRPDPLAGLDAELPPVLLHRLVEALDFGVMLLETDGRVRFANRYARLALGAGDVLGLTEDRITLHGPQQQRAFLRALVEVADDRQRMLCLGGGVPGTKLALTRWHREADGSAVLLATLQTGERQQWPALRAYARERRLTEGEADVMQQLVLGDRPPQIAVRRGSSEGTVRSQIKSLLEKTGTHSMRELVVEALHLPPMPGHAALSLAPRRQGSPPEGGPSRQRDEPQRRVTPPSALLSRESHPARTKRRFVRGTPPMDRGARVALCAAQFAWPPAA
jgi:DNA-binding CsgD family transcriptional regulator